jgi:ABC-type sugar transport system ATPase subunit
MSGGRVAQVGPPLDVYRRPANTFVASFLGNPPMNLIPAVVVDGGGSPGLQLGATTIALSERFAQLAAGREVTFGIRPEHLGRIGAEDRPTAARIDMEVQRIEPLGAETIVIGRLPGVEKHIFARFPGETTFKLGDRCPLALDLQHAHIFDEAGNAIDAAIDAP